jgi:hypothetical protein
MAKNDSNKKLEQTLESVGINSKLPTIISHGYSREDIKNTHRETNNLIQESLKKNSLGECIHITGEMRALTDPFHRYICEEINQQEKNVFRVVYNIPEENMKNSTSILKWNLESWASDKSDRKWYEELRTIYAIANRSVNLYALDTSDEIQYSVFGNKYILLQEKHKDRAKNKHTWLLESELVNSFLTARANELIKKAKDVDEGNYRRFTKNISGITSKRFLSILREGNNVSIENLLLDEIANDFTDSPEEIIESLIIMGFVKSENNDLTQLTEAGREFIK